MIFEFELQQSLLLQPFQHLDRMVILPIQLEGLLVVLNGEVLFACIHVGFGEGIKGIRALGIHLSVQLEDLDGTEHVFLAQEQIPEAVERVLSIADFARSGSLEVSEPIERGINALADAMARRMVSA